MAHGPSGAKPIVLNTEIEITGFEDTGIMATHVLKEVINSMEVAQNRYTSL